MDAVDGSVHFEVSTSEDAPSLLTIVLDTNPRAWAALEGTLPLGRAVANVLVFVNSHLAFSSSNQVAIVASHSDRAVWLYPAPPAPAPPPGGDVDMADAAADGGARAGRHSADKFTRFAEIETTLLQSLTALMATTTEADLEDTTTLISGALTLALAHVNKTALALPTTKTTTTAAAPSSARPKAEDASGLHARILVVSVSDSAPAQYIPTMNAVFAAAHSGIAVDVLSLHGSATFLQQAAYITRGTFLAAADPQGLLAYLMLGFSAASGRDDAAAVVPPGADAVDFRAACFCHRRVVDTGFVCSICLSIFCEVPPGADCLTCGTHLALGNYGAPPAVVYVPQERRKKKKKGRSTLANGDGREETGSAAGTPRPS